MNSERWSLVVRFRCGVVNRVMRKDSTSVIRKSRVCVSIAQTVSFTSERSILSPKYYVFPCGENFSNIFKFPTCTLKQWNDITHHHLSHENHIGGGLITRNIGNLLKSSGWGGKWEGWEGSEGTDSKV